MLIATEKLNVVGLSDCTMSPHVGAHSELLGDKGSGM